MRRFDDAVRECERALAIAPASHWIVILTTIISVVRALFFTPKTKIEGKQTDPKT
jgi:hypothetical protein